MGSGMSINTVFDATVFDVAKEEKLFNNIKALCEGHSTDSVLSVLGQLAGGTIAQRCPNKETAYTALFGRAAQVSFTTNSYLFFIKTGIDRFFDQNKVVLNAAEVKEQYDRLKRN